MQWNEFLDKVRAAKAMKISTGFNIGIVTRLIYAGSFNTMLTGHSDYLAMPPFKRYQRMTAEVANALKSDAQLPKSSKSEPIGIRDIDSEGALILWRHTVNPLFTWPLYDVPSFKNAILNPEVFGYAANTQGKRDDAGRLHVPFVKNRAGKTSYDLYASWEYPFENPGSMDEYNKRDPVRKAAIVGIIVDVKLGSYEDKKTGTSKPRANVVFFDGFREYETTLWPNWGSGLLNAATMSDLRPCALGILVIKPSTYRGKKGGSLVSFYKMSL